MGIPEVQERLLYFLQVSRFKQKISERFRDDKLFQMYRCLGRCRFRSWMSDMICWAEWNKDPGRGQRKRREGAAGRGACASTELVPKAPHSTCYYARINNRQNKLKTLCRALSKQFLSQARFYAASHGLEFGWNAHECVL